MEILIIILRRQTAIAGGECCRLGLTKKPLSANASNTIIQHKTSPYFYRRAHTKDDLQEIDVLNHKTAPKGSYHRKGSLEMSILCRAVARMKFLHNLGAFHEHPGVAHRAANIALMRFV